MNRNWMKRAGWLGAACLVQTAPGISTWGVDAPLIFAALVGVRGSLLEAVIWGSLSGLTQDLLSSCGVGPHLAANCLAAMLAQSSRQWVYRERVSALTGLTAICMTWHQVFLWFFFRWSGEAMGLDDFMPLLFRSVLATTAAGAVAAVIVTRYRHRRQDPATA